MTTLVNVIGLSLIFFIIFWFWLYKPDSEARRASKDGIIDIIVDNGIFTPAHIQTSVGSPLTLRFLRKSPSNCASTILFPEFNKSLDLKLGETRMMQVTPEQLGEFEFTCQMGMYRGTLTVTD